MLSFNKVTLGIMIISIFFSICGTMRIHSRKNKFHRIILRCINTRNSGYIEATKPNPKKINNFPFEYHQELVVRIEDISNLGYGIARHSIGDNSLWVVMVPLVVKGELVKVRIYKNHINYSEADLLEVIESSENRVQPLCKYFSECGGCQYQHINIESQRTWKREQVQSLLQRIGNFTSNQFNVNGVVGTDEVYGYRTKITPHYDVLKQQHPLSIGFLKRGTRRVIDIEECIIATSNINKRYLEIRENIKMNFETNPPKRGATLLFREHDDGVEISERKIISQTVDNITFSFKAGEFFQNNAFVLKLLVEHVAKQVRNTSNKYLVDTYCGSGLFGISLARYFHYVYGIEVSELAVNAARETALSNNISNIEFHCGSSEAIFKNILSISNNETCIIIDPPRKGCDDSFLSQLFDFKPAQIIYISCDPSTQARDASKIVANGYKMNDITPFDMFPQTRHIENVITFII